ncbi:MAG: cyclic nucleotide-binding domain-containing protein [Candidatus Latescibacterota bacterium]
MGMNLTKVCPGCFLLQVPDRAISWMFNAWPDATKFLTQQGLHLTGIVYPDLRTQTDSGTSCNLVEFPLLYALLNQGMLERRERPCLVGTPRQLALASESFKRGLYGFYSAEEMAGCDLSEAECQALMREIEGLSLCAISSSDELLELVPLAPLEEMPSPATATLYRGLRIWKEAINVFGVESDGERLLVDCNLAEGETYVPPLFLDVKDISYRLFQIIDTGEEDGFSPKSCMHTLIQWRDKVICIDLPMNVSYLLDKVSISRTEIDAVVFTHNHDDHIGELSMLLQMDKKVTVICPKVVWRSILLKASAMFDMGVDELAGYFDHVPIRYGEEYDYAGLRILAHPSIHPVPCAVYRFRGVVGEQWRSYGHMSDILNFARCEQLVRDGVVSPQRFEQYRDFLLQPTTVKKIDVGTRDGAESTSVHGSWRDFRSDPSEHIVLGHIRKEYLDEQATVTVGQMAVAGSARDVGVQPGDAFRDKYRERALRYLADYFFALLGDRVEAGHVDRQQVLSYARILADSEIRRIQPRTPFLKKGATATFVDMAITGKGSVWRQTGDEWRRVANVNAGDIVGDIGVLLQVPRTASVRSETYMHVLRMPGLLFREIAIWLGIFSEKEEGESVIEKIWRHREIVQASRLFGAEVPLYLQNKIAQRAEEVSFAKGEVVYPRGDPAAILLGSSGEDFSIEHHDRVLVRAFSQPPVFGESHFLEGRPEPYRVKARAAGVALRLDDEEFAWIREVPILKLRLKQLAETRRILRERAVRQ